MNNLATMYFSLAIITIILASPLVIILFMIYHYEATWQFLERFVKLLKHVANDRVGL